MNTKHNVFERFESLVKELRPLPVCLWKKNMARVGDPQIMAGVEKEPFSSRTCWLSIRKLSVVFEHFKLIGSQQGDTNDPSIDALYSSERFKEVRYGGPYGQNTRKLSKMPANLIKMYANLINCTQT